MSLSFAVLLAFGSTLHVLLESDYAAVTSGVPFPAPSRSPFPGAPVGNAKTHPVATDSVAQDQEGHGSVGNFSTGNGNIRNLVATELDGIDLNQHHGGLLDMIVGQVHALLHGEPDAVMGVDLGIEGDC